MSDMTGKVIAITGGAGGIGEATARLVHSRGASVVLCDRNAIKLDTIVRSLGDRAVAVVMDVTQRSDNEKMVAAALESFGHLDCVF